MSPNADRLPTGTSSTKLVLEFFRHHRSWYKPSWVAERLKVKYETVKKVCQRLRKKGLLVHKKGGLYIFYKHLVGNELARVEPFFDPQRELRVHDLFARGKVPGLFETIKRHHNGSWQKLPWNQAGKWIRWYPLPCGSKAKLTVYANDRATVEVSSITEDPWTLGQYCSFHDRVNGILQEWANQPCLFDEFTFTRLHINQDFSELSAEGPYVKTKVFKDTALAIYDKGRLGVRREYQIEGGSGIPAKHVKKLRKVPHKENVALLQRAEDSIQTQNLLAGATEFARQQQNLIKGNQRTILYFQDQLEKNVKQFTQGTFKDEILSRLNLLGDEFHDLGGGVVALTDAVINRAQRDGALLQHIARRQNESEELLLEKLEDLKEHQQHSLRVLTKIHRSMKTQKRGRKTRELILSVLAQALTVKQIHELTGISKSTIYSQLRTLHDLNLIDKIAGRPATYKVKEGGTD